MADLNHWVNFRMALNDLFEYCKSLHRDMRDWDGDLWYPHTFKPSESAQREGTVRQAVAAEITRLFYRDDEAKSNERKIARDDIPDSGIWLVDDIQADQISKLNDLKTTFQETAKKLRDKDRHFDFQKRIADDAELVELLSGAGLGRFHFKLAYRKVRLITGKQLDSVRWNYSAHRHVTRHKLENLRPKLAEDPSPTARLTEQMLTHLRDDDYVAEVYSDGERLVANVVYIDGQIKTPQTLPCSGVIFYQSDSLPRNLGWNGARGNDKPVRRPRETKDTIIQDDPIFEASPLYLYKKLKFTDKETGEVIERNY